MLSKRLIVFRLSDDNVTGLYLTWIAIPESFRNPVMEVLTDTGNLNGYYQFGSLDIHFSSEA